MSISISRIFLNIKLQEKINHYQFIAEAVQIGLFYPVMSAFMKSVDEWKSEIDRNFLFEEMALEYDLTDVLALDIRNDTAEFLEYVINDEEHTLLSKYFARVMNIGYNHHGEYFADHDLRYYDIHSLWDDTLYWIEVYNPENLSFNNKLKNS